MFAKINWREVIPKLKPNNVDYVNPRTERKEIRIGKETEIVPHGGKKNWNNLTVQQHDDIFNWWEEQRRIAKRHLGHTANVHAPYDDGNVYVSKWVDPRKYKSNRIVLVNNRTGKIWSPRR